jgi:hypothetical protein
MWPLSHHPLYLVTSVIFIYLLTYSMEQSPSWEANLSAASQEIPCILLNPKVHYRIHKCSPPVSIMGQLNTVHTLHPTSWRSALIWSSHYVWVYQVVSFFSTKTLYTLLPSPIRTTFPAHLILDLITRTIVNQINQYNYIRTGWTAQWNTVPN